MQKLKDVYWKHTSTGFMGLCLFGVFLGMVVISPFYVLGWIINKIIIGKDKKLAQTYDYFDFAHLGFMGLLWVPFAAVFCILSIPCAVGGWVFSRLDNFLVARNK